jgi:hypothetical protein
MADRSICHYCNATFQAKANLDKHMKKFHSSAPHRCLVCYDEFKN